MSTLIRALQRKDSRLNDVEVAVWDLLPMSVQGYCQVVRPRRAAEARAEACRWLASLGARAAKAVPYLIKALDDPNFTVRLGAIQAIGAIGPSAKAAKGRLLTTLGDMVQRGPTNQFFMTALDLVPNTLAAIAPRDPEVISAFLELLAHRSAANQSSMVQVGPAATLLAAMAPQDPQVVSALLELIAHPGPFVWPSSIALAWIEHTPELLPVFGLIRKVLPQRQSWDLVSSVARRCADRRERLAMLLRLLEDPDYGIRYHAVRELGVLGQLEAGAVPKLIELFDATEKEWEDLPEPAQRARFEAYAAFVKLMGPQPPFRGRYGPGRLVPPVRVFSAVPVAPPPAPRPAPTAGAPRYRFGTSSHSYPPMDRLHGFFGLHYQVILALGTMGPRARDAIPRLVREYTDATSPLRFEAAVARVRIDRSFPEVMPILAAGLEQADPGLRSTLLTHLARLARDYDGAVTLLIKALADSDSRIRVQAFNSLAPLGAKAAPALPVLIAALDDPESEVRLQALTHLRWLGTNAAPAVPALIKALGDPERPVRCQAVANLAALGDQALPALPALRALASDPTFTVRIAASNAVRTIEASTNASQRGAAQR